MIAMTIAELRTLYDYSYWANARLFPVVLRLTTEQFTQALPGAYGSVRHTLVHMLSAEWGWLERTGGWPRGPKLDPGNFPTALTIVEQWAHVEQHVRGFLDTLQDHDLKREVAFAIGAGPQHTLTIGQLLQHAALHGVHHRGQLALLLRSLGAAPVEVDLLWYHLQARAAGGTISTP